MIRAPNTRCALSWGQAWNSTRWGAGAEWLPCLAWNAFMCAMEIMVEEAVK